MTQYCYSLDEQFCCTLCPLIVSNIDFAVHTQYTKGLCTNLVSAHLASVVQQPQHIFRDIATYKVRFT